MIKRLLFTISTIIFINGVTAQNVGINQTGSDPDGSAMLDVSATNKGLLVPRMTKTQKFLIPNPANGLLVYQTDDTVGFWYYEKTQWVPLMRSIVFGNGLTGGLVQGKGEVDIQKTGVVSSTYGDDDNYPIITVNDYGQVTLAGIKKFVDNDTLNEIQELSLKGDTVKLSKNGGYVHLKGFWSTEGNSGLSATQNFLGTTNSVPLRFRVNDVWFGELNSGNNNISFGQYANQNSSGYSNIAIGRESLRSNNGGYYNTAVGWQSLYDNNSGNYNTALGAKSLYNNTRGNYNVGIGFEPLTSNTSGSYNVGIGFRSLHRNTTGNYNVGVGMYTLRFNSSGIMNAATGYYALGANVYGHYNAGFGNYSLYANNLGRGNAFMGYAAGYYNTSGYYNQGLGYYAGFQNRTGYYNVSLGYYNGPNKTNLDNTIALGSGARTSASDQARVGNASITSIGGPVAWTNTSDARFKTDIRRDEVVGLDFIMKLKPATYRFDVHKMYEFEGMLNDTMTWKSQFDKEKYRYTGFIAQEVERAAREVGFDFSGVDKPKNDKDYYGLRYAEFVVPIVKAIQEQQSEIEILKEQIELLKASNELLKEQNNLLKNQTK
jgi:hypothetical protein